MRPTRSHSANQSSPRRHRCDSATVLPPVTTSIMRAPNRRGTAFRCCRRSATARRGSAPRGPSAWPVRAGVGQLDATSRLSRLLDFVAYVIASPVERPTGRAGRMADRLSGPGSRSVQSRSGTGRGLPAFAACEASEKERQRHSCYDRPHIPRPPVSRKRESTTLGAPAFVSCIVILNVEPVSAWRRNHLVPDSGSILAERQLNQ